jgi:hypothetical protein
MSLRRLLGRAALALCIVAPLQIATSAPAHAATYCNAWFAGTFGYGNIVTNRECLTKVAGRGRRGYVEFDPPQAYQLAGRFFVTLTRNGTRVAKSAEYVNPIVRSGTSWPTPYVQTASGNYCVKVWFRRTETVNDLIRDTCHSL